MFPEPLKVTPSSTENWGEGFVISISTNKVSFTCSYLSTICPLFVSLSLICLSFFCLVFVSYLLSIPYTAVQCRYRSWSNLSCKNMKRIKKTFLFMNILLELSNLRRNLFLSQGIWITFQRNSILHFCIKSNAYLHVSKYVIFYRSAKASKYFPTFDSAQCNIFLARHSFSFSIHDVLQFWDLTKFMQDLRPPKKGSLLGTSMGAQKLSKSVPAVELDWC